MSAFFMKIWPSLGFYFIPKKSLSRIEIYFHMLTSANKLKNNGR